jgi:ABC-type nitrate/sulfonate/bicarbonate transport system substrate-binding protein
MPSSRLTTIVLAALITVLAVVATACGGSDSGSSSSSSAAADSGATTTSAPVDITVSYDWPTVDFEAIPMVVAKDKGYFEKHGVNVELIFPPDPASSAKVLATGKSNLALLTTTDMAFSVKSQLPITSIGNYTMSNNWGLFTKPGTPITLDTIKGKTISTYGDSWTKAMLPFVYDAAGITQSDVKEVVVDWDLPLLLKGKVDIATNTTNFLIAGVEDETGKSPEYLLAAEHGAPDVPVWVYAGNQDWLKANPDAARGFMAAMGEATAWACENPEDAATMFGDAYPDSGYSFSYNRIGWTDTCRYMQNDAGQYFTQTDEQWTTLGEALKSIGELSDVAEPSAYYTNEYLPAG